MKFWRFKLLLIALPFLLLGAKWPSHVKELTVQSGKPTVVRDSLEGGILIKDLSWAWRSENACFPGTQAEKFKGKQKFYAFELPAYSEVKIKLTPKSQDLNLYGYQVSNKDFRSLPPKLHGVVACEASFDYNRSNPGEKESIAFNSIRNPYHIVIAVVSPSPEIDDSFTLEISLKTKKKSSASQNVPQVSELSLKNGKAKIKGNLKKGAQIDLDWADSSQVACFPATQFQNFNGTHRLYRVELPRNSRIKISLKSKSNINLYALQLGSTDRKSVPPHVPSAICEASYPYGNKKPGFPRSIEMISIRNPYSVLIGVAGGDEIKEGGFVLKVEVTPR